MRNCPDERTLERLFVGEGREAERRHVEGCPGCALRMRRIERDLERIREALFADPPLELAQPRSRGRALRPRLAALALVAAAACTAVVLWTRPFTVEKTGSPSELAGFADTASEALFPAIDEASSAAASPKAAQLAALGAALRGERPCTLEDQLDTDSCDAQEVTTLAQGW
jgi:hypothetical protein